MILSIVLLLLVEIGSWQRVACSSSEDKKNFDDSTKSVLHRRDENSILDATIRESNAKNESLRFQRDSSMFNSTESSIRAAYERAMNQTITDYYAQRKAVMERYYAKQREIVDKFGRKTTTQSSRITTKTIDTMKSQIIDDNTTTRDAIVESTTRNGIIESTTISTKIVNNEKIENIIARSTMLNEDDRIVGEKNNSNVSWKYRMNNWNPRILEDGRDIDFQAESSNTLARRADKSEIPGYYRLGEFKGSEDERIVYQHNLGVGLKGSSQLEANFEVILEGAFAITAIEAFPYANTRAHFSWISGGPGTNSVKLNLKGYENEGFSYTVKVWGVPIQT